MDKFRRKIPIFAGGIMGLDKAVIALSLLVLVDGMLLWRVWAQLVFQLGNILSAFGAYFFLRSMVRSLDDVKRTIRVLAYVSMLVALFMTYEKFTGVNLLYSTFAGARAKVLASDVIRDGAIRAAGPFDHPILAGTFGGILLPLFIGLWCNGKAFRKYAAVGIAASVLMSFSASSSTALFGMIGGIVGLCFWPLRHRMRVIRWSIVGLLVSLHLAMKAPVWHLVSRIDLTGSSSSFHRYELINQCIIHFWDWALVGTKNYPDWGWDMWDLCNQYVAIADQSGLVPLIVFIAIIVLGFKYLGRARRQSENRTQELFIWAISAALFADVVAFLGVSYFDQTIIAWYSLLAIICGVRASLGRTRLGSLTPDLSRSLSPLLAEAKPQIPALTARF
jgi:hypothetical protein